MRGHHADAMALGPMRQEGVPTEVGQTFRPQKLATPLDRIRRKAAGKRSYTVSTRKRGRYTYARPAAGDYDDLAIDATIRQALRSGNECITDEGLRVQDQDLQRKVRVRKSPNLIVFAVDASWSMAAAERMEATKGAIMSLLVDAYQKRDMVCLISFRREQAQLVLPPTSSVEMAKRALADIPIGGKTPLSAGLLLALQTIERERRRSTDTKPLLILLTDGAGNVSLTGMQPRKEALMIAHRISSSHIRSVVLDTEHASLNRGLARELAQTLQAPCHTLDTIQADSLYKTVRKELQVGDR